MKRRFHDVVNQRKAAVDADPWRQRYHIMAPVGWISDPNGLAQFQGTYHICHQYTPAADLGVGKGWGHYTTKDFVQYKTQDVPLVPDASIDKDGCYSGSGFAQDGVLHFFYTGNVLFEGDYDYVNTGRGHYVNHVESRDGVHFTNKECLLVNDDYPDDMSCHVRDPKIFPGKDAFYLVLGARTKESVGCALVFRSTDLRSWTYFTRLETKTPFGYMWECPDLFELDGKLILLCCPQGVAQNGYDFENVYQNGYFVCRGTIESGAEPGSFTELDHGFDFYAPQTFADEKNRRILIGWMGMPDASYQNPETKNGWQHCLTLPRQLSMRNGRMFQYPIEEILSLRQEPVTIAGSAGIAYTMHDDVTGELRFRPLEPSFSLKLRHDVELAFDADEKLLTLSLKESGAGRTSRHVRIDRVEQIDVFSDRSSIEVFVNGGEAALSSRVYDHEKSFSLVCDGPFEATYYPYRAFTVE